MYMYFALILVCLWVCESVSLFGHCVIFHLPHTHTPLFSLLSLILAFVSNLTSHILCAYFACCVLQLIVVLLPALGASTARQLSFYASLIAAHFSLAHTHAHTCTHTHIEQCDMQYWCVSHWRFRFEVVFVLLVLLAWSLKLSQFAHEIYSVKLTKTCPESQMQYIILWKCILAPWILCHRRFCSCNPFVYFTFSFTIAIV